MIDIEHLFDDSECNTLFCFKIHLHLHFLIDCNKFLLSHIIFIYFWMETITMKINFNLKNVTLFKYESFLKIFFSDGKFNFSIILFLFKNLMPTYFTLGYEECKSLFCS